MNQNPDLYKQECFHPPYCPNEKCTYHLINNVTSTEKAQIKRWYRRKGWAKIKSYPHQIRCYQCLHCLRAFRYTAFKLEYREKKRRLNSRIFSLYTCGASNREIGRQLNVSERLVRNRLKKLAQWVLLRHAEYVNTCSIQEAVVYDGLENFARSQYEPNNINQIIGKDSLFIYDFNIALMNRKGKMSPRQKRKQDQMKTEQGKFDPKAIRTTTEKIFKRIYLKRANPEDPLVIYSDNHFQYREVVKQDLINYSIKHFRISSKDYRNYKNHLFAVNHSDLLTRQHIAAFRRETIAFSKTPERMVQKYILFLGWKNYFRTTFVKPHKKDPSANTHTPAMNLGLTGKPLEFHEFFDIRRTLTQIPLCQEWRNFYNETPTQHRIMPKLAA